MEADIREFLQQYSTDDLAARGILRGQTLLLNARSVDPLINLMAEQGITILEAKERGWYITSSGEFVNHRPVNLLKEKLRIWKTLAMFSISKISTSTRITSGGNQMLAEKAVSKNTMPHLILFQTSLNPAKYDSA